VAAIAEISEASCAAAASRAGHGLIVGDAAVGCHPLRQVGVVTAVAAQDAHEGQAIRRHITYAALL